MLTSFTIKKTFYKTRIVLSVDTERKTADALVTYDGLIIGDQPLRYTDYDTPEKAERQLSKPVNSDYATWIEAINATAAHRYQQFSKQLVRA